MDGLGNLKGNIDSMLKMADDLEKNIVSFDNSLGSMAHKLSGDDKKNLEEFRREVSKGFDGVRNGDMKGFESTLDSFRKRYKKD